MRATSATLFIACLGFSACTTAPVPAASAGHVSADRVLAFKPGGAGADAVLQVTRDSGMLGAACTTLVSVNRTPAALLDRGETVSLHVPAGLAIVRAGPNPAGSALCGLGTDAWSERDLTLKPGERLRLRIRLTMTGMMDILRADD